MKKIVLFSLITSSYLYSAVNIDLQYDMSWGDFYDGAGTFNDKIKSKTKCQSKWYAPDWGCADGAASPQYIELSSGELIDDELTASSSVNHTINISNPLIIKTVGDSKATLVLDFSKQPYFGDIGYKAVSGYSGYIGLSKNTNLVIKGNNNYLSQDDIFLGANYIYFTPKYVEVLKEQNLNSSLSIEAKNIIMEKSKDITFDKDYANIDGSILLDGTSLNLKADESITFSLNILDKALVPALSEYKESNEFYWNYYDNSYTKNITELVEIGKNAKINLEAPTITNNGRLYASGANGLLSIKGNFTNTATTGLVYSDDLLKSSNGFDDLSKPQGKVIIKDGAKLEVLGDFTNDNNGLLAIYDNSFANITGNFTNNGFLILGKSDLTKKEGYLDVKGNITISDTSNLVYMLKPDELLSDYSLYKLASATGTITNNLKDENIHIVDLNNETFTKLNDSKFFTTSLENADKDWYFKVGLKEDIKDKTLGEIMQDMKINDPNNTFDDSIALFQLVPSSKNNYESIIANNTTRYALAESFYNLDRTKTIDSILRKPEVLNTSITSLANAIDEINTINIQFAKAISEQNISTIKNRLNRTQHLKPISYSVEKNLIKTDKNTRNKFYKNNGFWLQAIGQAKKFNSNYAHLIGANFGVDKRLGDSIHGIFSNIGKIKYSGDNVENLSHFYGLGYYYLKDFYDTFELDINANYTYIKTSQKRFADVFAQNLTYNADFDNHIFNTNANLGYKIYINNFYEIKPYLGVDLLMAKYGAFSENDELLNFKKSSSNEYIFGATFGVLNTFNLYNYGYISLSPYIKKDILQSDNKTNLSINQILVKSQANKKDIALGINAEISIPFNDNGYFNLGIDFSNNKSSKNINANIGMKLEF